MARDFQPQSPPAPPAPKPEKPVELQADVVVMDASDGKHRQQYSVGAAVIWPRRAWLEVDANRFDNTLVEDIGVEGGAPFALLRSLLNGQTAKLVGYPGGTVIFYGPEPAAKKLTNEDGEVIGEEYPVPPDCVRVGNDIKHKKFAK